jgi:hypothetical protein
VYSLLDTLARLEYSGLDALKAMRLHWGAA